MLRTGIEQTSAPQHSSTISSVALATWPPSRLSLYAEYVDTYIGIFGLRTASRDCGLHNATGT